jgi:hypothetical protein
VRCVRDLNLIISRMFSQRRVEERETPLSWSREDFSF